MISFSNRITFPCCFLFLLFFFHFFSIRVAFRSCSIYLNAQHLLKTNEWCASHLHWIWNQENKNKQKKKSNKHRNWMRLRQMTNEFPHCTFSLLELQVETMPSVQIKRSMLSIYRLQLFESYWWFCTFSCWIIMRCNRIVPFGTERYKRNETPVQAHFTLKLETVRKIVRNCSKLFRQKCLDRPT